MDWWVITYTSSNTCRRNRGRSLSGPRSHRNLDGCCDGIWWYLCVCRCRRVHLLSFCSCIACSIRSHRHWKRQDGIWLQLRCSYRRSWGWSDWGHKRTRSKPCLAADRYCRGSSLCEGLRTWDEGNAWRSVFSLSVGDAFRDGDGFIGGEIGDIIWGWFFRIGVGLQDFRRRHEWISEMCLALDQNRADAFVSGSLSQDWTHPLINIIN